jgi:16S rRNA processing protein RimM
VEYHADQQLIIVGKIGASYGIKGWLHIHSFTEYGASILEYSPWYLTDDNGKRLHEAVIEDGKIHGHGLVAKFKDYNNPETARKLTGLTISIKRSQLLDLPENEFYWSDLEGLSVYNANNELLGTVIYLISTGSNDVLVINHDGHEHAIPYLVDSVVKKVDLEKREIHVD